MAIRRPSQGRMMCRSPLIVRRLPSDGTRRAPSGRGRSIPAYRVAEIVGRVTAAVDAAVSGRAVGDLGGRRLYGR